MADEMKELRGAVFDLIPDGVSVVALDEIEVDDLAPKTRNVKDEDLAADRALVHPVVRQRPSAAIPEMTQLRLTGRVLLSPYAVDDLGFTIVADGVESASAGTNTGRHSKD